MPPGHRATYAPAAFWFEIAKRWCPLCSLSLVTAPRLRDVQPAFGLNGRHGSLAKKLLDGGHRLAARVEVKHLPAFERSEHDLG